jgi:hypothetical protein
MEGYKENIGHKAKKAASRTSKSVLFKSRKMKWAEQAVCMRERQEKHARFSEILV